jgi:hypothetical protein
VEAVLVAQTQLELLERQTQAAVEAAQALQAEQQAVQAVQAS